MSSGANFAGLKFSSHSDYRMLSRRKRLLETFKEITKLFPIFLSQLSPLSSVLHNSSPPLFSFNKSRNNRVAFLQRHQELIIPGKEVSEKCDQTAEASFFIISFVLYRANRGTSSSFFFVLPFTKIFFYSRYSDSLSAPFPIAIYWSFKITVGKGKRGGDEAKHSCKKISSARKVTLRRIDQREYQALLLLC